MLVAAVLAQLVERKSFKLVDVASIATNGRSPSCPSWSKGADLRSAVNKRLGSNPRDGIFLASLGGQDGAEQARRGFESRARNGFAIAEDSHTKKRHLRRTLNRVSLFFV